MMERWERIKDTGWKVSDMGNIMKPTGKVVNFRGKQYRKCDFGLVHRIVAFYFCNPPREAEDNWSVPGYNVHHKNGICYDNRAENLEYVTYEEHRNMHRNKPDAEKYDEEEGIKSLAYLFLESLRKETGFV